MFACASLLVVTDFAVARSAGPDKGPQGRNGQEHAKGHKHARIKGHAMLGDNLKHDGKHAVGKFGTAALRPM